MRIALFDYIVTSDNAIGKCDLAILAALCDRHEFTVFSTLFENPQPDRIRWVRTQRCLILTHSALTVARKLLHETKCGMQIRICLLPAAALSLLQQLHGPMPGLHITPLGKLKVGESKFTITRGSTTHRRKVSRMWNVRVER